MAMKRFQALAIASGVTILLFPGATQSLAADPISPAPTETATPTTSSSPSPELTVPPLPALLLPATVDRKVPNNLKPSLEDAKSDRPLPYLDRCHTQQNLTASAAPCLYGDTKSKSAIVLFGDSHALSWFPAVQKLAVAKKWRLYSLTMSSCWPADIPAWNSTTLKLMTNCKVWRANTLKRIQSLRPLMVIVTGTRGFSTIGKDGSVLKGDERTTAWQTGMKRTVDLLKLASKKVVMISDTPASMFDAPNCLLEHRLSILACSTPITTAISMDWLAQERALATQEKIQMVDSSLWICPSDPCSPIQGNILIYSDTGHLTATFSATLEKPLWKVVSSY
ncbi:MAG: hypothetical protein HY050_01705 [Actinobacteria bacterium]|nr:hypothetical protein [Actinomycetota bacterium]